jgi:hypothetical protein
MAMKNRAITAAVQSMIDCGLEFDFNLAERPGRAKG